MCVAVAVHNPTLFSPLQYASPMERRHFFEFVALLSGFERKLGLQQNRAPHQVCLLGCTPRDSFMIQIAAEGLCVQLGTKLNANITFNLK